MASNDVRVTSLFLKPLRVISRCVLSKLRCSLYLPYRKKKTYLCDRFVKQLFDVNAAKRDIPSTLVISTPDNSFLPFNSK